MYTGSCLSKRFFDGLEIFLKAAVTFKKPEDMSSAHYMCCPCLDCRNEKKTSNIEEIREHLIHRGFMSGYTCWTQHGEHNEVVDECWGKPT